MMNPDLLEEFADAALARMADGSPRTRGDLKQEIGATGAEMAEIIHHLRGSGRIAVEMGDDGVPRYTLAEPPKDQEQAPEAEADQAPEAHKAGRIATADPVYTEMTDKALTLCADGVPRTLDEIAHGIGLAQLPDAVDQRLRRRMTRVGFSGHKGLFVLVKKEKKPNKPAQAPAVQAAEFPVPPACSGACGCHKPPAARSSSVLDATLAEARGLTEDALSEYLAILNDPRLNALIAAAGALRDASHGR